MNLVFKGLGRQAVGVTWGEGLPTPTASEVSQGTRTIALEPQPPRSHGRVTGGCEPRPQWCRPARVVFDEAMTTARWIGFALVWAALVLISVEAVITVRRVHRERLDPVITAAESIA